MSHASEDGLVLEPKIDVSIQRIVSVQLIGALVIALAALVFGWLQAGSALLGGLSVALPSAYMAFRLRRHTAVPSIALMQLLSAELGKWLLTGLMIGAVFVWVESLEVGFFFLGLVTTYGCGLAALMFSSLRSKEVE